MNKIFKLMRKDSVVALFEAEYIDTDFKGFNFLKIADSNKLPLAIQKGMSLDSFLRHRFVPSNRENVKKIIATISGNDAATTDVIVEYTRALSLNDDFWVARENEAEGWRTHNLYENKFNTAIAEIAFGGNGLYVGLDASGSPEYTTGGALRKCWRRIDGGIYLYKAGSAQTGLEPYSEFYSAQIAELMGINHVNYNLSRWRGRLCSTCKLFTSPKYSYVPMAQILPGVRSEQFVIELRKLDKNGKLYRDLTDMLVFDAVTGNTDRHLNNFGIMQDNDTLQILDGLSPIFDNGLSLFCYDLEKDMTDKNFYDIFEFFTLNVNADRIKEFMSNRHFEMLNKLTDFKFKKHSRHNLPSSRLKLIEDIIQKRLCNLKQKG